MHVKIRIYACTHTTQNDLILQVMPATTIGALQTMIYGKVKVKTAKQKLYYGGKELIGDHCLSDYNIKSNDVIQLMTRNTIEPTKDVGTNEKEIITQTQHTIIEAKSSYYQVGDSIDVIFRDLGAWFEAKIIGIYTKDSMEENLKEDELIFKIVMDRNEKTAPMHVKFCDIRPRSYYTYNRPELVQGMVVLVNYNIQQPRERGYWYDFKITTVTNEKLLGVLMGRDDENFENCSIEFQDEVMKIEVATPLIERSPNSCEKIPWRNLPLYCNYCKDVSIKDCKECSCNICGKKNHTDVLIICDECDCTYHLFCLNPPLSEIPPEPEWYCPDCKTDPNEIVKPGEKLKVVSPRFDFNYGFGSIPGVEVGTCWSSSKEVYEAAAHCTLNSGIHAREKYGVYSIMLGGKYIEEIDDCGEEFYISVSDGRHLPDINRINVKTGRQRGKINKALALNCNRVQDNDGFGKAEDWKKGKPIRIVRNYLLASSSKFAPKRGFRYDGIYKVVEYFPALRRCGDIAWRYLLRRDDETLPPWQMTNSHKKFKMQPFEISPEIEKWIRRDVVNRQIWDECVSYVGDGKEAFLAKVQETFKCVCCFDTVSEPFTARCGHTICITCLMKCFEAEIVGCPTCRLELQDDQPIQLNYSLQMALKLLFSGYERGRL